MIVRYFSRCSAERALDSLHYVLGGEVPHPTGSAENLHVRRRIERELRRLGYEPELQVAVSCRPGVCARVENLFVKVPGTAPEQDHVMVAAHYDSVPAGPGAADDGLGIATLLEVARAAREAPPRRPLLLLFTDGEELGMLGMSAFVNHPAYHDVALVINVEARGTEGPALLFQTGPKDGALIRAFASRATSPRMSSVYQSVYERLPNDTDFSVVKGTGRGGFNYALIGGFARYHTPLDSLAHLDPRSLQHTLDQTAQALAAANSISDAEYQAGAAGLTYFDLLGKQLVVLPGWLTPVMLGACALCLLIVSVRYRARANGRQVALWLLLALLGLGVAAGLAYGVERWLKAAGRLPDVFVAHPTSLALGALALGAASATLPASSRGLLARQLGLGYLYVMLGSVLARVLPGAAYLGYVPAVTATLGVLLTVRLVDGLGSEGSRAWILGLGALSSFITALLWLPLLLALPTAIGFASLAALAALWALFWLQLAPWLPRPRRGALRALWPAVASFVAALLSFGAARLQEPFSADAPQRASVGVVYDIDERRSVSQLDVSHGPAPEPLARLLKLSGAPEPSFPWLGGWYDRTLTGESSWVSPQRSHLTLVRRETHPGGRVLELSWRRELWAQAVSFSVPIATELKLAFRDGEIQGADVAPMLVQAPRARFAESEWQRFAYLGGGNEVLRLSLRVAGEQPLQALVCEHRFELPDELKREVELRRPEEATASQFGDNAAVCRRETW